MFTIVRAFAEVALIVAVQAWMLVQVSFGYWRLCARARRGAAGPVAAAPLPGDALLSVVIPAYREAATIEATLRRVLSAAADPRRVELYGHRGELRRWFLCKAGDDTSEAWRGAIEAARRDAVEGVVDVRGPAPSPSHRAASPTVVSLAAVRRMLANWAKALVDWSRTLRRSASRFVALCCATKPT